jgi:hypothetical protein
MGPPPALRLLSIIMVRARVTCRVNRGYLHLFPGKADNNQGSLVRVRVKGNWMFARRFVSVLNT